MRCTYDPETRGGNSSDGRKVKGTIHWVCAQKGIVSEVRRFQHLFVGDNPGAEDDLIAALNPHSVEVLSGAVVEPSLASANCADAVQFERLGYYCPDPDGRLAAPVFNQVVTLKDTWKKIQKASG